MKRAERILLAATAILLLLPATAVADLGSSTVGSQVDGKVSGRAQAYRFTARAGAVDRLNVYLDGTNTAAKVVLGLYSSRSNSQPDQRLRSCTIQSAVGAAWNRCAIPAFTPTDGTPYYLVILGPDDTRRVRYRATSDKSTATYGSTSSSLLALPDSWSGGADRSGTRATVYADAMPAAPPPPPAAPPPVAPPPPLPPPPPSGFPNADNTGVPPGTTLTPSGTIYANTAGQVIDGRDVSGSIVVKAPNVTIRNTRIRSGDWTAVDNSSTGLTIVDSTLEGGGQGVQFGLACVFEADETTIRRVEISGCENGIDVSPESAGLCSNDVLVEDSWIHDMNYTATSEHPDPHTDGIQINECANHITIRHNTIRPQVSGTPGTTSAIIMYTGSGVQNSDVLIEGNILDGSHASVALYCPRNPATNIFVRTNRMLKGVFGSYTDSCSASHVTDYSGNVDDATGAPISGSG
jgi:hypothetical protein